MESMLRSALPAQPPAPYIGGKRLLSGRIIRRLAAMGDHDTYVEPFIGMGGVFLRRPWQSRAEVIGDASRDVTNLFRVLQHHYQALMDVLRWQITSRDEFERLRAANPDTLTDLHRAARFLYIQRVAFGGKVTGRHFGVTPSAAGRFDVAKLGSMLERVHERLSGVVIECLPYYDLLPRYDRAGTLFFCDPPYHGSEADYGTGLFKPADHARLALALRQLRGRWLLSINDCPPIRDLYAGCQIQEVEVSYTIGHHGGTRPKAAELLVSRV